MGAAGLMCGGEYDAPPGFYAGRCRNAGGVDELDFFPLIQYSAPRFVSGSLRLSFWAYGRTVPGGDGCCLVNDRCEREHAPRYRASHPSLGHSALTAKLGMDLNRIAQNAGCFPLTPFLIFDCTNLLFRLS